MLGHIVEIAMIYVLLLLVYRFVRGSTGDSALKGTAILVGATFFIFYLIAEGLDYYRIQALLDKLINYFVFALIIIFQPELRRGVVRLGRNRVFGRLMQGRDDTSVLIGEAVFRLARKRIGALIAIERGVGLSEYAERGVSVDAIISPELLESVFVSKGPLHDGAIIIRGARVVAASCLFPLTENSALSSRHGTRHRAGIGISEDSDCVSIIVSEETGRVSIALRGQLFEDLSTDRFDEVLRSAIRDQASPHRRDHVSAEPAAN